MSEPLIQALENRIEHGETKAELKEEVLSVGHSEEVFESAYREAALRVAERQAEQEAIEKLQESPERVNVVQKKTSQHAPGEHTLRVGKPELVSVSDMLSKGWQMARSTLGTLGAGIMAAIIGLLALGVAMAVFGGVALGFATSIGPMVFAVVFVCAYFLAILYGLSLRYIITRTLLQRRLGKSLWSNLGWGFASLGGIFVLMFYLQAVTMFGFLFLVVPGIIVAVYFSQSAFVFAGEDRRGSDVLVRSVELVYGHFWQILVRYAAVFGVLIAVSVVGSILSGIIPLFALVVFIIQILATYWALCVGVVLFESLQHMYPGNRFAQKTRDTLKLWIRVIATIAILVTLLVIAVLMNLAFNAKDFYEEFLNPEISVPTMPTIPSVQLPEVGERQNARADAVKQNLNTVRSQAELYWSENLSYAGVCAEPLGAYDLISRTYELGVGDVHCADDRDWYLAEAELPDGTYYCVDSSASSEVIPESRKGQEACF